MNGEMVFIRLETYPEFTKATYSGVVKPVNNFRMQVTIPIHTDESGLFYLDDSMVDPGFVFEGGWTWGNKDEVRAGKVRLHQCRTTLERLLLDGGFTPCEGRSVAQAERRAA